MRSTQSKPVSLELSPEKKEFIEKGFKRGLSPTVISRGYERRFGAVLSPQTIEALRVQIMTPQQIEHKKNIEEIRSKLPTHDRQLEFARALLEERMKDPNVTNSELVLLAREYRSNISESQRMATMSDSQGNTQFVLIYGDTVKAASQDADIDDAKFTLLEGDDDA